MTLWGRIMTLWGFKDVVGTFLSHREHFLLELSQQRLESLLAWPSQCDLSTNTVDNPVGKSELA